MNVSTPRFPLFDSLRGIAALSVFAVHLPLVATMSDGHFLKRYLVELNLGVAVFFLISGFLLYRPFVQARYANEAPPSVRTFGTRRALRIVPAYWVALPIVVLMLGPSGESATASPVFTPWDVVTYFGFLQIYDSDTLLGGISAAWTLCVEVTFYAMLPLWALFMRRLGALSPGAFLRTELLALAGLFAVGFAWTAVAASNSTPTANVFVDPTRIEPWLYVLPAYLDHFAVGMALAVASVVLADRGTQPKAVRVIERAPWIPWLVAALAFVVTAQLSDWFAGNWGARFTLTHELQALVALGLLLPAVFGSPDTGWVRRLLSGRALLWVGLVSYGLYLWHAAVIAKLVDLGALNSLGDLPFTALALALSLLAAAASFYLIERHALRLGRRLSRRRRSQDADVRMGDLVQHERPEPGVP
jgi:peptidoglycan/LPS O-acetylase OafA/YrhL